MKLQATHSILLLEGLGNYLGELPSEIFLKICLPEIELEAVLMESYEAGKAHCEWLATHLPSWISP